MDKKKTRLSIGIEPFKHKLLKMRCAQIGISLTDFVLEAIEASMDIYLKKSFDSKDKNGIN